MIRSMSAVTEFVSVNPDTTNAAATLSVVTSLSALRELQSKWHDLENDTQNHSSVFQSFDWNMAWAETYVANSKSTSLHIIAGYEAEKLVFLWPLMREKQLGFDTLTWLTDPFGQYGDVMCRKGQNSRQWVESAIGFMKRLRDIDILRLRKVKKNTEEKDFAYHSGFNTGTVKGVLGISKKWGQSKLTVSFLKSQYEILKSLDENDIALIEVNEERKRKITEPFDDNSRLTISSESNVLIKKSEIKITLSGETNGKDDKEKSSIGNFDIKFISNTSRKFGYTAGTQMSQQNIGMYVASSTPDFKKSGGGLYLLLRYDLPKINLLAGGRMDMRKVNDNYANTVTDYNIPSGSIGMAYHPTEAITIKLNESTGFSIPDEISRVSYMYDITIKQDLLNLRSNFIPAMQNGLAVNAYMSFQIIY